MVWVGEVSDTTTYCSLGSASGTLFPALAKSLVWSIPFGASEELSSPSSLDLIHSFKPEEKGQYTFHKLAFMKT